MTDQDLARMLERLQGDLEEAARRGRGHITREPCPGCGRAPTWPYRNAEHVCAFCRRLLSEAIEVRLYRPDVNEELVVVSERNWETRYMEGEYEPQFGDGITPRRRLEEAMHNLVQEVSQPAPGEDVNSPRHLFEHGVYHNRMSWRIVRKIHKTVAARLVELDLAIRDSLAECAKVAQRKGQDVLLQLAAGNMTVDDLNKANAKLARIPARKRK